MHHHIAFYVDYKITIMNFVFFLSQKKVLKNESRSTTSKTFYYYSIKSQNGVNQTDWAILIDMNHYCIRHDLFAINGLSYCYNYKNVEYMCKIAEINK